MLLARVSVGVLMGMFMGHGKTPKSPLRLRMRRLHRLKNQNMTLSATLTISDVVRGIYGAEIAAFDSLVAGWRPRPNRLATNRASPTRIEKEDFDERAAAMPCMTLFCSARLPTRRPKGS